MRVLRLVDDRISIVRLQTNVPRRLCVHEGSDEIAVALVTAACVIGLAVAFKNVISASPPFLFSTAAPIYPFIVYLITRPSARRFKYDAMLWSAVIVAVAVLTLLLYVF